MYAQVDAEPTTQPVDLDARCTQLSRHGVDVAVMARQQGLAALARAVRAVELAERGAAVPRGGRSRHLGEVRLVDRLRVGEDQRRRVRLLELADVAGPRIA